MRNLIIILFIVSIIGLSFIAVPKSLQSNNTTLFEKGSYAPVAVLELYTSEGCSSCPPADILLPKFAKLDSNVFPISFHVDYWNRLGWIDPFSSHENSERQRKYINFWHIESVYTPQLIVNGQYDIVGSNEKEATDAIKKVLKEKSQVKINIEDTSISDKEIKINCFTEGDIGKTDIIAVMVQRNASMNVLTGENSNKRLSHINVARSFARQAAGRKNTFEFKIPAYQDKSNWQIIVFAQHTSTYKIQGASVFNPN